MRRQEIPAILQSLAGDEPVRWWGRPDTVGFTLGVLPWLLLLPPLAVLATGGILVEWGMQERNPIYFAFALVGVVSVGWWELSLLRHRWASAQESLYGATDTVIYILSPCLPGGMTVLPLGTQNDWRLSPGWRGLFHLENINPSRYRGLPSFSRLCNGIALTQGAPGVYFLSDYSYLTELLPAHKEVEPNEDP